VVPPSQQASSGASRKRQERSGQAAPRDQGVHFALVRHSFRSQLRPSLRFGLVVCAFFAPPAMPRTLFRARCPDPGCSCPRRCHRRQALFANRRSIDEKIGDPGRQVGPHHSSQAALGNRSTAQACSEGHHHRALPSTISRRSRPLCAGARREHEEIGTPRFRARKLGQPQPKNRLCLLDLIPCLRPGAGAAAKQSGKLEANAGSTSRPNQAAVLRLHSPPGFLLDVSPGGKKPWG